MASGNPYITQQPPLMNSAQQILNPDLAAQQTQLSRQQQMAQMLMQQGMQPNDPTQVIGGWAVKQSPLAGLGKIAQALTGGLMMNNSDEKQLALAKVLQERTGALFGQGSTDPNVASGAALTQGMAQQPNTQDAEGAIQNNGGIGPTNDNAARMGNILAQGAGTVPQGGGLTIPGMDPKRAQLLFTMDQPAYMAALLKQYDPTDMQRNDRYLGITSDQSRQSELAKRLKEGTMSLTPGQTNILPNGSKVVAPDFTTGLAGGFDAQGNPTASAIPNADVIAANRAGAIAGATKKAELPYLAPTRVDAATGPVLMTPQQQINAANGNTGATGGITNPGNLRPPGASKGFQTFATPEEGLAALDKNLQSYGKQGVNTLSGIISKWAPPSENNTPAYIADVSKRLGIDPNQKLDMNSPIVRQALSTAITLHENGSSKVFGSTAQSAAAMPGIPLKTDVQKAQETADLALKNAPQLAQKDKEFTDMAAYGNSLNGRLSESQALLQRIEQSRQALTKFQAGGGGELSGQAAQYAQALHMPTFIVDKIAGGDLSASQQFQKYAAQEALQTMQQSLASDTGKGSQGNRIAMQLFIKNNPNIDTDPRAIEKIFNFQTQQHNQLLDQSNSYQQYKTTPGNDPSQFPNYWANEQIKRGYVKPEIKSGYAKGVATPANIQAILDKYK